MFVVDQSWALANKNNMSLSQPPRKRKRETLEEDESMDEEDFSTLKSEVDKQTLPYDFDLPEDLTGTVELSL